MAVKTALNLTCQLGAVGTAVVKENFARAKPARVQIGKVSGRNAGQLVLAAAKRQQQAVIVIPHRQAEQERGGNQDAGGAREFHSVDPNCSLRRLIRITEEIASAPGSYPAIALVLLVY